MPNRLINETSPYLLQHANNPVDWYSWGEEALERAKREDKPILLSIGYSACHWCHVMERESFENDSIATRGSIPKRRAKAAVRRAISASSSGSGSMFTVVSAKNNTRSSRMRT